MSHIFISYSHLDDKYAHRLEAALRQEGFEVWLDDRIDYGSTWPRAIQENLDQSSAVIVLMTSNSLRSEWVQNELSRAQRKRKPIFPLVLEGEPWVSVEAIQYVDVADGRLPPPEFYRRLANVIGKSSRRAESGQAAASDAVERKREEILRALHQVIEKNQTWNVGLFEVHFLFINTLRYLYAKVKDLDRLTLHAPEVVQRYKKYLEDKRIRQERRAKILAEADLPFSDPGKIEQLRRKSDAVFPNVLEEAGYERELGIYFLWYPSADLKELPGIASELVALNQKLSLPLGLIDVRYLRVTPPF